MIKIIKGNIILYFCAFVLGAAVISLINSFISNSASIQSLQEKDMDVLKNVDIVEYRVEGNFAYIHVVGEKVRSDCGAPIKLSGFYSDPLTPFDVVDLKKNLETNKVMPDGFVERPAIKDEVQDFDWWAVSPVPDGPFFLYVDYLCGQNPANPSAQPYIKKNIFGPFELSKIK